MFTLFNTCIYIFIKNFGFPMRGSFRDQIKLSHIYRARTANKLHEITPNLQIGTCSLYGPNLNILSMKFECFAIIYLYISLLFKRIKIV